MRIPAQWVPKHLLAHIEVAVPCRGLATSLFSPYRQRERLSA
jgi:hypothetical protein